MMFSNEDLARYRSLFPILEHCTYLNHAATSPLSTRATAAFQRYLQERSELYGDNWEAIAQKSEELRALIGTLINAEAGRIAFVPNTNTGLNIIATGLDWQAGDEILLPEKEFPSNVYPWLNLEQRGVKVRFLPIPSGGLEPARLQDAIRAETRLLALSSVGFLSGYAHDLKAIGEICRERGIWFIVDGIQGTGVLPMNVEEFQIDALANGGHKWLMWPQGFGFLYVSERLQAQIQAAYGGWIGVGHPEQFLNYSQELSGEARRYETGGYSSAAVLPAIESLKLFLDIGIPNIQTHLRDLTGLFIDGIKELGLELYTNESPDIRSGIVTFYPPGSDASPKMYAYLQEKRIKLSIRENMLRMSPHFYNNKEDILKVLNVIETYDQNMR